METSAAEARLNELLVQRGIDTRQPSAGDPQLAIEAMRDFSADKFTDIDPSEYGDLFLAQFGTYDWGQGETFQADLTRQFKFLDDEGEFLYFDQLQCTFHYEPTDELRALGSGEVWSSDVGADDFWFRAAGLAGFTLTEAPTRMEVAHNEV